jgi:hypothetical protein
VKASGNPRSSALVQLASVVMAALLLFAGVELARTGNHSGVLLGRFSPRWFAALALYAIGAAGMGLVCLAGLLWPQQRLETAWDRIEVALARLGLGRWLVFLVAILLPSLILLGRWGSHLQGPVFRAVLLIGSSLAAAWALPTRSASRLERMLAGALLTASVFGFLMHLVLVTDYPFKLGWSEGNRLWDYSLYFGRDRYIVEGEFQYPTYLTPGRHGLWGLPFLIPGVTIAVVRLWDAILWTVPYLLLGLALFTPGRHGVSRRVQFGLALWVFLFLSQGPIYTPLVLSALVLAVGYDARHPWRTALATAVACFYAGISRWTWLVAPALWAVMWSLAEDSGAGFFFWRRLRRPGLLAGAGLLGAVGSYVVLALTSPRADPVYATALSQPLLWYRLLPSATNPLGVVPALILAVCPILGLIAFGLVRRVLRWDGLCLLGTAAVLIVFLGVGLVASVKIGGGSNLHNLDMLLVGLILLAAIALTRFKGIEARSLASAPALVQALLVLAVIVPGWFVLRQGGPLNLPSRDAAQAALEMMRPAVQAAAAEGEVLFLDQRQLLTFGEMPGVPLVLDYELKDMANQAMSANTAFFEGFYQDLRNHRFALIVTEPVPSQWRGRGHAFGEEDDAQLRYFYRQLDEYYQPAVRLDEVGVWLLEPRPTSPNAILPNVPIRLDGGETFRAQ